jgi:membrane-bound serine protease (ClpP class)
MPIRKDDRLERVARRMLLATVAALLLCSRWAPSGAQEQPAPVAATARYITLKSPIDDEAIGWVRRTTLELQDAAVRENRQAYLLLEVPPGTSEFHHIYGLAMFLTSANIANVTTIAWVPETVTGHNAIIPLVCNEIVMHPDAQLGDIGLGLTLEPEHQQDVRSLVAKRRNKKVNEYLATALMDPSSTLVQLTLEPQAGSTETRLVTEEEVRRIQQSGVVIKDRKTVKEPGTAWVVSGAQARDLEILVMRTANDRRELADAYALPAEALREERGGGGTSTISRIAVEGMIDPLLESFLKRQIERAVSDGARTIVFDITSGGGMLAPSSDLAYRIADLERHDIRTIAFVPKAAYSGAALIAFGCDEIYMTPDAKIGDILMIEMQEGGAFERVPEKAMAPLLEWLGDLAQKKGRPVAVCQAMANPKLEVYQATNSRTGAAWFMTDAEIHASGEEWVKGLIVPETQQGLPLTLGARRAHELRVVEAPVADFDELKQRVGIPVDVNPHLIDRTWLDDFVFLLNQPAVTGLLFFVGIVCIYLELHFMTGFLGIISAVCFGLFFWSKVLGGTSGWLEVVLFLLGVGCLAMEIFVIPGFGVFGVSGALLIFAALVMASQTFGNLEPGRDLGEATKTVGIISGSTIAVIIIGILTSRYLPSIPLLNQMILTPPGMRETAAPDEPRLRPELTGSAPHGSELVGKVGTAMTVLRPAGKAEIDGRYVDVVSDGPFLNEGTTIEVVRVSGNRIVVRGV